MSCPPAAELSLYEGDKVNWSFRMPLKVGIYPPRLYELVLSRQAALDLHDFLEVILLEGKNGSVFILVLKPDQARNTEVQEKEIPVTISLLTPSLMVSLAWLATSFTNFRAAGKRQ